jgi:hypothetical protein
VKLGPYRTDSLYEEVPEPSRFVGRVVYGHSLSFRVRGQYEKRNVVNSGQIARLETGIKGYCLNPEAVASCESTLEALMSLTVVLAVGLDSSLLANQGLVWQSAGYLVTSAGSIREAIAHIRDGDFDLVLLGRSLPADSRERLTFLIRATGSQIPVVCVADSSSDSDAFADATITGEPIKLLEDIGEVMAKRAKRSAASRSMPRAVS